VKPQGPFIPLKPIKQKGGKVVGLLVFLVSQASTSDAQQKACDLDRTIKVTMKYLLYLPKDYRQKPSWPLLLFLHGSGEKGDDLNLVKKHGPPKLIEAGKDFPDAGHDSWTEAYNDPQLYEWLLQQKRMPKKVEDAKK
jgi:predicted peptidase